MARRWGGPGDGSTALADGSRFIVLITDGVPTYSLGCVGTGMLDDPVDPSPLIGEASAAFAQGVRTFVIGSPGSEGARQSLSQMAEAGGTAPSGCTHAGLELLSLRHDSTERPGRRLERSPRGDLGCSLQLSVRCPRALLGAVLDPGKVNVRFTASGNPPELIRQSLDAACADGWQFADDFARIRLCPSTCDRVQSAPGILSLEFGCTTEVR